MKDFIYYTPTQVVFGKDAEEKTAELVKQYHGTRVLVHYGGSSAERSGLLDKICTLLKSEGITYFKLGGVVPNPHLSKVREGINLCLRESIDFVLAVGGGSVIDSSKAIAYGALYDGDVWDFFIGKATPTKSLPTGAIVTIPAAGSEMSDSCVITNEEGYIKVGYSNDLCRCKFAVMNPILTYSLPEYQTACGAADIMMHTMERYFSHDEAALTDSIAEGLMRTVKDSVHEVLKQPKGYEHRANIMWASSLSHNGLTGCGTTGDFATHKLEHVLSAVYDVAHGAGLTALWASWARYVYKENVPRFAQFAVNVMGVHNDFQSPEETALRGIEAMESFYKSIGMPISIKELLGREVSDEEITTMADRCSWNGTVSVGNFKKLDRKDMMNIYNMAR